MLVLVVYCDMSQMDGSFLGYWTRVGMIGAFSGLILEPRIMGWGSWTIGA